VKSLGLRCTPLISVMETTDLAERNDRSGGYFGDGSMVRRVFVQTEMRSAAMIVLTVGLENASQMRLVQDDHVVETLSSNGADQAFHVRVLPGARRRGDDFADAQTSQSSVEHIAVDGVAISRLEVRAFWSSV
jgi:hypothetical protein